MTPDELEEWRARTAHDLKASLAVILGYGELIAYRDDEETRLEASRHIVAAGLRLSEEIDALVARARPPVG